jgi:preprotein translocase subunit SecA
VSGVLMRVRIESNDQLDQAAQELEAAGENLQNVTYTAPDESGDATTTVDESTLSAARALTPQGHVGRNDPCPCGSGKKFKLCHGKLD